MSTTIVPRRLTRTDAGSALILTLMAMAVVMGLATTVAVVSINNLQSSMKAQHAGAALNAADAGIAQAMAYLRSAGVRRVNCSPTCAANPWGNSTTPTSVALGGVGRQAYKAWIEPRLRYPENDPAVYRIHSTGTAADGGASRTVTADVTVGTNITRGVHARTISGGGDASVSHASVFSTGCVYDRSKIDMVAGELDIAYGVPVGVHSSQIITDANGSGQFCPTTSKPIHSPSVPCSTENPSDHDLLGGPFPTGSSCLTLATQYPKYYQARDLDGDGTTDVNGSFIKDESALARLYNMRNPTLAEGLIDQLRSIAISQHNYWEMASPTNVAWKRPDEDNAIMFFDLTKTDLGGTVDLNEIEGFSPAAGEDRSNEACSPKSLTIVIEGGNAKLNSKQEMFGSLILTSSAPYGQVTKANGNASFIGTIFADNINLVGSVNLSLDACFLANLSPALLVLNVGNYRELDRCDPVYRPDLC
jgi:hypothetical protein